MGAGVVVYGGEDDTPDDLKSLRKVIGSDEDAATVQSLSNDKIRAALALNLAGANYAEIAAQLQFRSPAVARGAIERALAETVDEGEDRTKLRLKTRLTLDRFLKAVSAKALDTKNPEQLAAMRVALQIMDKKIALDGLNAPTEVTVRTPDSVEFSRVITLAALGAGIEMPEEADPWEIEAEVVDDEEEDAAED